MCLSFPSWWYDEVRGHARAFYTWTTRQLSTRQRKSTIRDTEQVWRWRDSKRGNTTILECKKYRKWVCIYSEIMVANVDISKSSPPIKTFCIGERFEDTKWYTSGTGTAYPSGTHRFYGVRVTQFFIFCVFFLPLFVLLICWPLYSLYFFQLRFQTLFVSSNNSFYASHVKICSGRWFPVCANSGFLHQ